MLGHVQTFHCEQQPQLTLLHASLSISSYESPSWPSSTTILLRLPLSSSFYSNDALRPKQAAFLSLIHFYNCEINITNIYILQQNITTRIRSGYTKIMKRQSYERLTRKTLTYSEGRELFSLKARQDTDKIASKQKDTHERSRFRRMVSDFTGSQEETKKTFRMVAL